jgi:hypothetical protein
MKNHMTGRITVALFILIFMIASILTGCTQAPVSSGASAPALSPQSAAATAPETVTASAGTSVTNTDGVGYISLDVNPSIQLAIKGGVVLGVTAYNDDGEQIVLSNDVVGMTYKSAVDKLIGALNDGGYLAMAETAPSVVITTYGDVDEDVVKDVETQANESLTTLGVTCPVYASDVSDDMADVAKGYGLTPGRYLLISYLADSEGLTIEEAIAKYSHMRMGDLTHLVGEAIGLYGDLSPLYEGLTAEQISVLNAAKEAYSDAMHAAAQAYHTAKAAAIDAFKTSKEAAQAAFKETKDKAAWKSSKEAAIQAFQNAKSAAKAAFEDAKAKAKADFMTAIASLGLDPSLVENLLAWNFDDDWNYDGGWGNAPDVENGTPDASATPKPTNKPSENKPSEKPADHPSKTPGQGNNGQSGNNGHTDNGNKPDKKP